MRMMPYEIFEMTLYVIKEEVDGYLHEARKCGGTTYWNPAAAGCLICQEIEFLKTYK